MLLKKIEKFDVYLWLDFGEFLDQPESIVTSVQNPSPAPCIFIFHCYVLFWDDAVAKIQSDYITE